MADAFIPGAVYNQNPTDIPLESQPVSFGSGIGAQFGAAMRSTLGGSLETQAIGRLEGGAMVPYDQVKAAFDAEKLDASVFEKGQPVRAGEAQAVLNQQLAIQKDRDRAERAHLGAVSSGVAGFVGGLADPAILGAGLIAGPVLGAARAGLGMTAGRAITAGAPALVRMGAGAAEGGIGVAAYEKGQQQFGSAQGDRDITSGQIFHDAVWGSIVGGALKGAFGARPTRVDLEPFREMIVGAENSAGYAKAHGLASPDEVVSANANPDKRAYGLHQITPETAKSLGFSGDPELLKNGAYNEQVAQANLEKLYKKFGNDPQAIAVAWNAGPGWADKFVKAGHDRTILPKETQTYLARIDKMHGTEETAAPAATPPTTSVTARDGGLVVARKMPDGSVMYGSKGDVHFNLMSDDEIDGKEEVDPASMGFAEPGGAWMSREDAAKFVGSDQARLESERYRMAQEGNQPSAFGRRGIPDKTDIDVAKTAIAQAEAGSEINVEPVIKASIDEGNGLKAEVGALTQAVPERNSELTTPAIKDKLLAVEQTIKNAKPEPTTPLEPRAAHPAIAEIQRMAKEDMDAAASIHAGMTGEAPGAEGNKFEAYMKAGEKEFEESEGAEGQPDFQRALEAAVQCGLKNGVE